MKRKWKVDPMHSEIGFSVKHMMISKVKGTFNKFHANIFADPNDLTTADIEVTVDLESIDTRNDDRDAHLKSADFFEIERFPHMTFRAVNIEKKGEQRYDVTGDLTIRDVTRRETFTVTVGGVAKDPMTAVEKVGFIGEGMINRKNYGLVWNAALESGGVLVGEEIDILISIEAEKVA